MTLYNFLLQAALVGCVAALVAALRRGWTADPLARIEFAAEARGWALASLALSIALAVGSWGGDLLWTWASPAAAALGVCGWWLIARPYRDA
jgi:hypothetical protein